MRKYLNAKFITVQLALISMLSCNQFSTNPERLTGVDKKEFVALKKWLKREYGADLPLARIADTSTILTLIFDENKQGKRKVTYTIDSDGSFITKNIFYQVDLQKKEDLKILPVCGAIKSIEACGINLDYFARLSFEYQISVEPSLVKQLPVEELYDFKNLQIVSKDEKSIIEFTYIRGRISAYRIDVFYDLDRKFLKEEKLYTYHYEKNSYELDNVETAIDQQK